MPQLFAYGSLVVDDVLVALLGRLPDRTPWALDGWRAARLRGLTYPGLVAAAGGRVSGVLLRGLTAPEWDVLDAYETSAYERRAVGEQDGEPVHAYVYLAADRVLDDDWDLAAFRRHHLARFLADERLG